MVNRIINLPLFILLMSLFTNTKLPADFLHLFPALLFLNIWISRLNFTVLIITGYATCVTLVASFLFLNFISLNVFIDIVLVIFIPALFYNYLSFSAIDVNKVIENFYVFCLVLITYALLQYLEIIPIDYILNELPKESGKFVILESEPAKSAARIMLMITMCEFIKMTEYNIWQKLNLTIEFILIIILLLVSSKTGLIFIASILLFNTIYTIMSVGRKGYLMKVLASLTMVCTIVWIASTIGIFRYISYVIEYLWLKGSFVSRLNYILSGAYSLIYTPFGLGLNFNYLTATHLSDIVAFTGLSNGEIAEILVLVQNHDVGISSNFWIYFLGFFGWLPGLLLIYAAFKRLRSAIGARFIGLSSLIVLSLSGVSFVPGTFLLLLYFLYMVLRICDEENSNFLAGESRR